MSNNFLTLIYSLIEQQSSGDYESLHLHQKFRILLTTPVVVAGAERNFSRMKLVNNIQCSTMSDDRLSALAVISIGNRK